MLNSEEHKRYNRHLILPEFGITRQEKLKAAKILVIGAGGLGCPALLYLVSAGVGEITIIDPDHIETSNLQRQILYTHNDVGAYKAEIAAKKLKDINPYVSINAILDNFNTSNCIKLVSEHDLVIDGSDNFATRYLVNDACVLANKPLVFGSIFKFEGQVSVFNYNNGPTYRCIYPEPPAPNEVPSCSEIGVLGVLPGMIGVLQATEAIKIITGIGEPLSGKLLIYDVLTNSQSLITIEKNTELHITKLLDDYDSFCGVDSQLLTDGELSSHKASLMINSSTEAQIIDVREPWEAEICKIEGSILIPLKSIPEHLNSIDPSIPAILYCHHGIRSKNALQYLQSKGFTKLYNLSGGIDSWAREIDHEMPRY